MIHVDTAASTNTGGPEALVQLALVLAQHRNVSIFPTRVHPRFVKEYASIKTLPQSNPKRVTSSDIVILPEIKQCVRFGHARVFIWLLSTNYRHLHADTNRSECSYIAHNAMISQMYNNIPTIRPYITPSTVKHCRHVRRSDQKRSLVLIDNDSPAPVSRMGLVVKGFTRERVMQLFAQARHIVDWKFVGTERMPIEALLCGAFVFTSRHPENSALGCDFRFPNESFVDTYDELKYRLDHSTVTSPMTDAIEEFESLGPNTMWLDAKTALRL